MPDPQLTTAHLNRALLARQLLLDRVELPPETVVERTGALQAQYAPSAYVGLWTRIRGLRREDVTRALEERRLVQGTLLRVTIHLVSRAEYWRYATGVRDARRRWVLRTGARTDAERTAAEEGHRANAERLARALAGGPRWVRELDGLADGFVGNAGLWVDLVRVPPSGTWERRRADRLALADAWVGPCDATPDEGLAHLVAAYLRAFGPAPWRDIASWAGIPVADAKRGGQALSLVRYRGPDGRELVDLRGAPLPDPDVPAPARFLAHFDAATLAHARRTGLLPEEHRARIYNVHNPFSMGTVAVDGRIVAGWHADDGRIVVDPFEPLTARQRDDVEAEREALEAFHG